MTELDTDNGTSSDDDAFFKVWRNKAGNLHRTDGPAIITMDHNIWYLNGWPYWRNKAFQEAAKLSDEDMLTLILKYGNIT